jgi:hypothetical protein
LRTSLPQRTASFNALCKTACVCLRVETDRPACSSSETVQVAASERLQAQVTQEGHDAKPDYYRPVLRSAQGSQGALGGRQPLAGQELSEGRLRRRRVGAVAETREDVREKRLRFPSGAKSALRALQALAVLVAALVVHDRPGGAAPVDVASHCSSSSGSWEPRMRSATSGFASGNCQSLIGRLSKKKKRAPVRAASSAP